MALSKKEVESIRDDAPPATGADYAKPKSKKKIWVLSISSVVVALIVLVVGFNLVQAQKPGPLDDFAKCLTEEGAVMYGAAFCQYTHAQKGMFGKSMKYINAKDFTEDSNIKVTPTWLIDGQYYENVQTIDRLVELSGCEI